MTGVLETAKRWHGRQAAMALEIESISPHVAPRHSWAAGFPAAVVESEDGLRSFDLVPLTSQRMLAEEGSRQADGHGMAGLAHCVGGRHFVRQCVRGESRILSVRETGSDGVVRRISTVEIGIGDGAYAVVQHYGRKNAEPEQAARDAVARYLAMVNGGIDSGDAALPVDRSAFAPAPASAFGLPDICGYDADDREAVTRALRIWEHLLSRPLRGLWTDEFVATTGLDKVAAIAA